MQRSVPISQALIFLGWQVTLPACITAVAYCMRALQVDGQISATYDDFLSVVAKGRRLSREAVREVAKGRVWSGSQAMEVRRQLAVDPNTGAASSAVVTCNQQ